MDIYGIIGCLCLAWTCSAESLTFELPDNDKMCFYEVYKGYKRYIFEYEVIKGGEFDIDVSVTAPNGKILYKETKKMEGEFEFESSVGEFSFCFSNEFSTISHKTISFGLEPVEEKSLADDAGDDKPTAHTQMEASLENIHSSGTKVVAYQRDYRLRESRGRYIAETLSKRVTIWATIEAVIILLSGLGQVVILRTFFTEKRSSTVLSGASKIPEKL